MWGAVAAEESNELLHILCNRRDICKCEMAQCGCTRARYLTLSNLGPGASQALQRSQRKYHDKIDDAEISERHRQNPLAADTRLPASVFARVYVHCYCLLLRLRI
ncbi:hypothetical protein P692DRAFT_201790817, partial [Suillus brevipes Sb2]